MKPPEAHPIAAYFDAMKAEIIAGVVAAITDLIEAPLDVVEGAAESVHADVYYDASFLARRYYGTGDKSATNRIHGIPEAELRRTRVGPGRGRTLFYGLDIMRYEGHVTEKRYHAIQERKLTLLEDTPEEHARLWRLGHALNQGHQ